MHTNIISANKLGGTVHLNDNISDSWAAEFHGNGTQSFGNLYHDFAACRSIFESYIKEVLKGIS